MPLEDVQKIYTEQDIRLYFACFEDDCTTPVDLTGGLVEVELQRTGLHPYAYAGSTDADPELTEWTDRTQGTGVITLALQEEVLPLGFMRLQMRSIKSTGETRTQQQTWVRVLETI